MNPSFQDPFAALLAVAAACVAFALAAVSVMRVRRFRDVRSRTELLMGISLAAIGVSWLAAAAGLTGVLTSQQFLTFVNSCARTTTLLAGIIVLVRWLRQRS